MVSCALILLPLLLAATQSGEAAKINSNGCDFSQFGALNAMNIFPNFECYPVRYAPTAEDIKAILMTHNKMRMKVAMGKEERGSPGPQPTAANMREMVWDMQLADLAQAWANQCSFSHDEYASRQTCKDSTIGQNLLIKDSADMFSTITMGQKVSRQPMTVSITRPEGSSVVHALKLSFKEPGCCRWRRHKIASIKFPQLAWRVALGEMTCQGQGRLLVPLEELRKKEGSTAVKLRFTSRTKTVHTSYMTLDSRKVKKR